MQSYITQYGKCQRTDERGTKIPLWTHNRHHIPHPAGPAIGCLLWTLMRKLTISTVTLQRHHTVVVANNDKLEQLERLRSEDTPRRLMITHNIESYWIPSQNKVEWPWRYRSRSKVITCDTPSHASNHLYQIWKESIQNYRRNRADTIFKVKAKWPWKYRSRSRSKVITYNTPSNANDDLCQIWKEYKQNCRFFFQGESRKIRKICEKFKS